uniref:Uncharacterized protein n=1 Tax=Parastrongyloides trichosuri TaxID=131310 RepID=A0A0N4Z328_PARTI
MLDNKLLILPLIILDTILEYNISNSTANLDFLTPSVEELHRQQQDAKICLMGWLVMFIWVAIICYATRDFWFGSHYMEEDSKNNNNQDERFGEEV